MGWFGKIVLGILILGALAILADVITWIYEVAWIIPIIIVLVVGFFIWSFSDYQEACLIIFQILNAMFENWNIVVS